MDDGTDEAVVDRAADCRVGSLAVWCVSVCCWGRKSTGCCVYVEESCNLRIDFKVERSVVDF